MQTRVPGGPEYHPLEWNISYRAHISTYIGPSVYVPSWNEFPPFSIGLSLFPSLLSISSSSLGYAEPEGASPHARPTIGAQRPGALPILAAHYVPTVLHKDSITYLLNPQMGSLPAPLGCKTMPSPVYGSAGNICASWKGLGNVAYSGLPTFRKPHTHTEVLCPAYLSPWHKTLKALMTCFPAVVLAQLRPPQCAPSSPNYTPKQHELTSYITVSLCSCVQLSAEQI